MVRTRHPARGLAEDVAVDLLGVRSVEFVVALLRGLAVEAEVELAMGIVVTLVAEAGLEPVVAGIVEGAAYRVEALVVAIVVNLVVKRRLDWRLGWYSSSADKEVFGTWHPDRGLAEDIGVELLGGLAVELVEEQVVDLGMLEIAVERVVALVVENAVEIVDKIVSLALRAPPILLDHVVSD